MPAMQVRRVTYTHSVMQEEQGGLQDLVQLETDNRIVRSFVYHDEEVHLIDEQTLQFGTDRYPTGNYDGDPSPGDSEYSYYLERKEGDGWKFVKALRPYQVETAQDSFEDWE